MVKNLSAKAGGIRDEDSIPGSGRFPAGGHSNSLQYSCLENPTDRGDWWATIHRVAKCQTRLKRQSSRSATPGLTATVLSGNWLKKLILWSHLLPIVQKLWGWGSTIHVFINLPDDSGTCKILRTTGPEEGVS